jgi:hypothetical protein
LGEARPRARETFADYLAGVYADEDRLERRRDGGKLNHTAASTKEKESCYQKAPMSRK